MRAEERRALILATVQRQGGASIAELVPLLGVSRLTVRGDLAVLDREGLLRQIRGGAIAVPGGARAGAGQQRSPLSAAQRAVAREGAALVGDGDSLALDGSALCLGIAQALSERRGLRVVAAALDTARCLADEPSNTVLLAGSLVRPGGLEVRLHPQEPPLHGWRVRWCFLAAEQHTPQGLICDPDPVSAEVRRALLAAASEPVLLLGSGPEAEPVGAQPVAQLRDFRHVLAGAALSARSRALLAEEAELTLCEPGLARRTPPRPSSPLARIAFANMSDAAAYCMEVRRGVERAAASARAVERLLLDNGGSDQRVLANVETLLAAAPDLVIEYGVDEAVGNVVMDRLRSARIPVIAVDLPLPGATYFGVDNYRAGQVAGLALAQEVLGRWEGRADLALTLESPRMRAPQRARLQGQLDALQGVLPGLPVRAVVAGHDEQSARHAVRDLLAQCPRPLRILPLGVNDEAVLGAIAACREADGAVACLAVSLGLDWRAQAEARRSMSPLVGGVAFHPEQYGEVLLRLALDIRAGRPVPPATFVAHRFRPASELGGPAARPTPSSSA